VTEVLLERARDYFHAPQAVSLLLDRTLPDIAGARLLIKPNFVALKGAPLCCTHASVIAAAARHCVERGARVAVGDSPAFGTAGAVAAAIGLPEMLRPLGVPVITLGRGVKVRSGPVRVPVSADALEADLILNLPKFKAHSQMRFSGAVKNLFGCVTGVSKAWLHAVHGDKGGRFAAMICGLLDVLPPVVSLMDGVEAMHRTGPIARAPFPLGLLAAGSNPVALDTASAMVLGVSPEAFPVWRACALAGLPGAQPDALTFPLLRPEEFDAAGFELPQTLKPESFRPDVLLKSLVRRIWLSRRADGV
jgi:uncharacterized protein (DUF362 family)